MKLMQLPRFIKDCLAGAIAVCFLQIGVIAQVPSLRLTAQFAPSVLVVSPVTTELMFENIGDKKLVLQDFPRAHLFRVEISNKADRSAVYRGLACPTSSGRSESYLRPVELPVGATYRVEIVLANRWSDDKTLLGPAFTAPGQYLLSFSYAVVCEVAGKETYVKVRSAAKELEIRAPNQNDQAAFDRFRAQQHLSWTLEPQFGLQAASEAELAAWERELREYLIGYAESPWAPLVRSALAFRLYDGSARLGTHSAAFLDEASKLLPVVLAQTNFPYKRDVLFLRQLLDQARGVGVKSNASQPPVDVAQSHEVENQFARLLQRLEQGDWEGIRPLLHQDFTYNSRVSAAEWLQKLKSEFQGLPTAKLVVKSRTLSVTHGERGVVLAAEVNFESGQRKSQHRVRVTFSLHDGAWLLTSWVDRGLPTEDR